MNKLLIIILSVLLQISSAGVEDIFRGSNNPNGKPFLFSIGIEKNIHSFRYYDESTFYVTLPISNFATLKYRENVLYKEDMVMLKSEHDMIKSLDKHYSLEFHIPFYKIWNN